MAQASDPHAFQLGGEIAEEDVASAAPERTAVASLFAKHARRVRRFLSYRLRNEADAQDATQDVFLKLWRHERQGTLRGEGTSYMFSAVHSMAVDVERHRAFVAHEIDAEADPDAVHPDRPGQEELAHWRAAMAVLVESLKTLPEKPRRAFVLFHFHNMGYDDVAVQLGVTRRSVERYLREALAQCRKDLERFL